MNLDSVLQEQNNYIRQNNYKKTCLVNLYCCELSFYRNSTHYLQKFICYLYKY